MPAVTFLPQNITVNVPEGSMLLDTAKSAGIRTETPCGGRGLCKKCLVQIKAGEVSFENNGLLPDLLIRQGYILLCRAKVKNIPVSIQILQCNEEHGKFSVSESDLTQIHSSLLPKPPFTLVVKKVKFTVQKPETGDGLSDADRFAKAVAAVLGKEPYLPIAVLRKLPEALRQQNGQVIIHYFEKQNDINVTDISVNEKEDYGIAVDIGTTTVAVQVVRISDGEIMAAKTKYNEQISCGLDVISRINYAQKKERLEELKNKVLQTINGIVNELVQNLQIRPEEIKHASVAGNVTMIHLLLGILPEYIRLEPYTPAVYAPHMYMASDIGLLIYPETPVFIAPGVGSYLGGDIVSGMLCTPLAAKDEGLSLFIDIGTNGEMVLGNHDFLIGCACSAGPAFEGGGIEKGMRASKGAIERAEVDAGTGLCSYAVIGDIEPAGICGSGMISLLASLFETGWIDPAGKLSRAGNCDAIVIDGKKASYTVDPQTGGKGSVFITEADIENIIRAKAAIFSACRILLKKVDLDFEDLSKIYIAGGFGRYLNIENAVTIGLLPDLPEEKFVFLGNASLSGAKMALLSEEHRQKQLELARKVTYLDLSVEPEYMHEYTAALFLPHTDENLFKRRNK